MGDLSSRRGRIEDIKQDGGSQLICAIAPLAEMIGYAKHIRSITQARASFSMRFARYEVAPHDDDSRLFELFTAIDNNYRKQKISVPQGSNGRKRIQTLVSNPHRITVGRGYQISCGDWKWSFAPTWQVIPGVNLLTVRHYQSAVVGRSRLSYVTAEPPSVMPRYWQRWSLNPHGILRHVFRASSRKNLCIQPTNTASHPEQWWQHQKSEEYKNEVE